MTDPLVVPIKSAKPMESVAFGSYPQTADGANAVPIRWRVLQNTGTELFILSEFILDCKRYHRAFTDVSWRDCDLRGWLNEAFFNAAFSMEEKKCIMLSRCAGNGEGSPVTEDRVFLLSVAELRELSDIHGKDLRRAAGTDFAKTKKADGCKLYVYDKTKQDDYMTVDGQTTGCSWWWLRTQPEQASRAFFVGTQGSIRSYGRVNLACYGVRPALKLNL